MSRRFLAILLVLSIAVRGETEENERELVPLPYSMAKCDEKTSFGKLQTYSVANPMPFCANRGTCRSDFDEHPEQPCNCTTGWAGPHCEFEQDKVPACQLQCQNNGTCVVGATSWQQLLELESTSWKNQHFCICPPGFSGPMCEYAAKRCGDTLMCQNGGSCVELQKNGTNETTYHCDCTTAGDEKIAYAGEQCEYRSTTFCSEGMDENGRHFCVNGGTCAGESYLGCICKTGFVGPICEFTDMDLEMPECALECYNQGICRKGAKDLTILKTFGIENRHLLEQHRHLLDAPAYDDNFEHCVCPNGFGGLQCEHLVDICPGGKRVCLNGGECKAFVEGDDLQFKCDCTMANSPTARYAGDYCEMESTEFCTVDRKRTARGQGQDAFCTNGGTCLGLVEHGQLHPGCQCPIGYSGDHCEHRGADAVAAGTVHSEKKSGLAGFLVTVMCILLVILMFLLYRYNSKSHPCINMDGVDSSQAPTLDAHLRNIDPWKEVIHDETNLKGDVDEYEDEDYHDIDLADYTPRYLYEHDTDGTIHIEEETDDGIEAEITFNRPREVVDVSDYEDSTFGASGYDTQSFTSDDNVMSLSGSVILDDMDEADGIMRPAGMSSLASSNSDRLYVFNDSNDGSEHHRIV